MSATAPNHFMILESDIAHEIIDGEAIIIHFQTGNYYSLNGTAAVVWEWLQAGATTGEISNAFTELSVDDHAALLGFLEGLVSEGVLRHAASEVEIARESGSLPLAHHIAFVAPRFEKYNDMQQLLLADPIHEVDERGWPHVPAVN